MTRRTTGLVLLTVALAGVVLGSEARPLRAAERAADVVFILDESGSMNDEIADVRARVGDIASALEGRLDVRYALVAFGGAHPGQTPEEPATLTNFTNSAGLSHALSQTGAFPCPEGECQEMGLFATTYALTQVTGFRAGAGVCAVLISDEESSFKVDRDTDLASAKAALQARNAAWFGIVTGEASGDGTYGGPGSVAESSGGAVFSIGSFRANATPVLEALLSQCGAAVLERATVAAFTATPTSGVAPLTVSFEALFEPSIVSFEWTFGDGDSGSGRVTTHVYGSPGTFTATLTITDTSGSKASASQVITVRSGGPAVVGASDCTITGTSGPDVLTGTPGDDVICGFDGDDVIRARGGDDVVIGGRGDDTLIGGPGDDLLLGQGGDDLLRGLAGNDRLLGSTGLDRLLGGSGTDRLLGGQGTDILRGGGGDDVLRGDGGRDRMFGEKGADRLLARDRSRDLVNGGLGRDRAMTDARDQVVAVEVNRR